MIDDNDIFQIIFLIICLPILFIIIYNSQPLAQRVNDKDYKEQVRQISKEASNVKECLEEDKIADTGISSGYKSTKKFIKLESGKIYTDDFLDSGYNILYRKKIGETVCMKEKVTVTFYGDVEKIKKILSENNFDTRFIGETKEEEGKLIYIKTSYFPYTNPAASELYKLQQL